jgi:DNA-binding transcriptional LysR family regulator
MPPEGRVYKKTDNVMEFRRLSFFKSVCVSGFVKACQESRYPLEEGMLSVRDLQESLGFDLFTDDAQPSAETLTEDGKNFLPSVDNLLLDYADGFLSVYNHRGKPDTIKIKSTFSYGKNLLLPCITVIHEAGSFEQLGIDLLTSKDDRNVGNIDSHVIFKNLMATDYLFFDHKWTLKLGQGLYAGEGYLLDTGGYPKDFENLQDHSILGYETSDKNAQRAVNWHLFGQNGLSNLEPSILISSPSVIIAAVEANLGIGPVIDDHEKFGYRRLFRVIPEIHGPPITLDFAIRRKLPDRIGSAAKELENVLLREINRLGLEVVFQG